MLSPVQGFHNLWQFSKALAGVGQHATTPPATKPPQQQTGGVAAHPTQGDTFKAHPQSAQVKKLNAALQGQPRAQAALANMEKDGKLGSHAAGGTTLASQLSRMQGNPQLLGQTVRDIAHPGHMKQGTNNDFCAETDAMSKMARKDPGNYARVIADLSTKGHASVHGGVTLNAKTDLDPSKMQSMSATQKLMAPALSEFQNGAGYKVDAQGVSHATKKGEPSKVNGTYSTGMEKMDQALLGHDWDSQYINGKGKALTSDVNSAVSTIRQNLKAGEQPSVSSGGHWYNITGFRATPDGGRMTVNDPLTGESKTVNARHFLNQAEAVTFDKSADATSQPAAAQLAKPKHEKPGGGGRATTSGNPVGDRC
jgi:hypothetical protein